MDINIESNICEEISKLALPPIDIWTGTDFWKFTQEKPSLVLLDFHDEFAKNIEIRKISKILNKNDFNIALMDCMNRKASLRFVILL